MSSDSSDEPTGSWSRAIFGSPIVQTLLAMLVVSLGTWSLGPIDTGHPLALSKPLAEAPWTIVTSVYAHRSVAHLVGNTIVIATAGTLVSFWTTTLRFHGYVVATGAIAALTTLFVTPLVGPASVVLGASGAGFALVGYLLAGNRASNAVFDRLSTRTTIFVFAVVGAVAVVLLGGLHRGLVGHATGIALGVLAGRLGVLSR